MNNEQQEQQSLEFDIDAILESHPNPMQQQFPQQYHGGGGAPYSSSQYPPTVPPRGASSAHGHHYQQHQHQQPPPPSFPPNLITAERYDDQQTISTIGRDQTILTRDDPPIAMFRPSFDPDRFADEEAPSLPRFSYRPRRNNTSDEALRHLNPNSDDPNDPTGNNNNHNHEPSLLSGSTYRSVSFRDLYIVVLVMSLLLLAIITGLAIWLIALKTNDTPVAGSIEEGWVDGGGSVPSVSPTLEPLIAPTKFPTLGPGNGNKEPSKPLPGSSAIPITTPRPSAIPTTMPTSLPTVAPQTPSPTPAVPVIVITDAPTTAPITPSPTSFPSSSPTVTATTVSPPPTEPEPIAIQQARSRFIQVLEGRSVSSVSSLMKLDSPQYLAYNWMVHDPNFDTYSNARLLQRWVLATFALGLTDIGTDREGIAVPRVFNGTSQQLQQILPQSLQSWVQYNTNECDWFYSQQEPGDDLCDSDGMYLRLDLRSQHLQGTLPTEIGLLSDHLEHIFLYDNAIQGTLPTELALLTKLERFEMTRNRLKGTIPTQFGRLNELVFLGLGVNSLMGTLPTHMGQLDKLRTIGLERNKFQSTIPTEFGHMVETRLLNLDFNQLTGTVPQSLGNMSLLRGLNLSFNRNLSGKIPNGLCEQHLSYLQVDCNMIDCPCCTSCHYQN